RSAAAPQPRWWLSPRTPAASPRGSRRPLGRRRGPWALSVRELGGAGYGAASGPTRGPPASARARTLPLALEPRADGAASGGDARQQRGDLFEAFAAGGVLQLAAEAGQQRRAHVAAATLEAVRGEPQGLGIGRAQRLLHRAQAVRGVVDEGFQQLRILVLHD